MGHREAIRRIRNIRGGVSNQPTVSAGQENFGRWSANVESLASQLPLTHTWIGRVNSVANPEIGVTVMDAGCGNATRSFPIGVALAGQGYPVRMHLLDRQADALTAAQETLRNVVIPPNLQISYDRQHIADMVASVPLDGIYCSLVLQFLPPYEMEQALIRFREALQPGGFVYLEVPSIFNAKNLDPLEVAFSSRAAEETKRKRLLEVCTQTDIGTAPIATTRTTRFPNPMYFLTLPALEQMVARADLTITDSKPERDITHLNGLSDAFPEQLTIIAKK